MLSPKTGSLLSVLILFSFSCASGEPKSPFDFPANGKEIFEISSEKTYFPELIIPYKIEKKAGFLIVIERSRIPQDKPLIHLIDKSSLKYIRAKGVMGHGPNEITDGHLFDTGFSDSTFWVNSIMSKRMSEFSLYDRSKLSINEFRQPESMYLAFNMQKFTDSTYLCVMANDPNRLVEFDDNGNRLGGYGKWEPLPQRSDLSDFLLMSYNKGWFKGDHESNIFVKASIYRDRLEIFDGTTKAYTIVEGPRLKLPPVQISGSGLGAALVFSPDQKYGHRDIAFGEKYIYNLYGGISESEFRKTDQLAKTIFVLTKKGEVKFRLDLDRSVESIVVDEALGKIYGITTDEQPGIAVFDISSVSPFIK